MRIIGAIDNPQEIGMFYDMSITDQTTPPKSATKTDGRRQRSQTSRARIINAAMQLCEEGILVSTAQEIADKAEVSLRTVFRHFNDMETVFGEMDQLLYARFEPLFVRATPDGTLEDRTEGLLARRAEIYDGLGPYIRSTTAQLWKYEGLAANYARLVRDIRRDLTIWLPELKEHSPSTQLAAEALTSFETWDRLRRYNGLSVTQCQKHLSETLLSLMNDV